MRVDCDAELAAKPVQAVCWMFEELRVSPLRQVLGTSSLISEERIRAALSLPSGLR